MADSSKEYIFKRDFKSSMRLNYNHYLMRNIAGYLLHPSIPTESADLRIADVGTGTGIWALELAQQVPKTTQIDCFDIAPDQYPASGFVPSNVRFHTHDAFKDFPAEFVGKFDVVHCRFFLCIVNDPDARPLLKQLITLLKPGGYLQWFEPLPLSTKVVSRSPGASQEASEKLVKSWQKPKPDSTYTWVEGLKGMYGEEGLVDAVQHKHDMPDYLRPLWAQSSLAVMEDVIPAVTIWDERVEAMKKLIKDLQVEIAEGVAVDTPFQCVVGRKP